MNHNINDIDKNDKFSFEASNNFDLVGGTGRIMNFHIFSAKDYVKLQGQLITLFGEPLYSSFDVEEAYNYVIIAKSKENSEYVFHVYCGPTGPAIGGDINNEGILEAAKELEKYIKSVKPADYEYVGYYFDSSRKIEQKIVNGKIYYEDHKMTDEELEKAYELCFPNK